MKYPKSTGAWLDADKLRDGAEVKLVSECVKQESQFKDKEGNAKTENVAKVRIAGEADAVNMRLNWATVYGLIEAFGDESKDWIGQPLKVRKLDALVGDTMRTIVYLIPVGFELRKNAEKKMVIAKIGGEEAPAPEPVAGEVV